MIVAFCGSKGSGKSTSADLFKAFVMKPTEEIAIAGHLKEVCAKIFGISYARFIDPTLKEVELEDYIVLDAANVQAVLKAFFIEKYDYDNHVRTHIGRVIRTPRALLQYIGTEVLHPIDPLVHVKVALKKKNPDRLTLITDLRFIAEFNYFKENYATGFTPVYVRNPAAELKASVDAHPSERQFEQFKMQCRILDNQGSMDELRVRLKVLAAEFV